MNFDDLEAETVLTETDFIEETHELTTNTSYSTEDLTIKINKYQGLANFAKKIAAEEKKDEKTEENVTFLKKIPKKLQGFFELFGGKNQNSEFFLMKNVKKNEKFNIENGEISKEKIYEHAKNKRQFNRIFPLKKLKKTQSSENLTQIYEENEENKPKKRQFLARLTMLRPQLNEGIIDNLMENSFEKEKNEIIEEKSEEKFEEKKEKIEGKTRRITRELSFKIQKKLSNNIEKSEEKSDISVFGKANGLWGESWEHKVANFQKNSVYGHFPSYSIRNIIIKGGDDLRQELIAMQLIRKFKQIFHDAGLKLFLRPYDIMVTSQNSGILGEFF